MTLPFRPTPVRPPLARQSGGVLDPWLLAHMERLGYQGLSPASHDADPEALLDAAPVVGDVRGAMRAYGALRGGRLGEAGLEAAFAALPLLSMPTSLRNRIKAGAMRVVGLDQIPAGGVSLPLELQAAQKAGTGVSPQGFHVDVRRQQNPNYAGAPNPRTGIFYSPANHPINRNYSQGTIGGLYGGPQRVEGTTAYKTPLVVKAGLGGDGVIKFLKKDSKKSKDAHQIISDIQALGPAFARQNLVEAFDAADIDPALAANAVEELMSAYGGGRVITSAPPIQGIPSYSRVSLHSLASAARERLAAEILRRRRHDALISLSGRENKAVGGRRINEIFDVRETHTPAPDEPGVIGEPFKSYYDLLRKFNP